MATLSVSAQPIVQTLAPIPSWKEVKLKNVEKNKEYVYIQEVKTGDLYWYNDFKMPPETKMVVFGKCMLIGMVGNIAATFIRCMYYMTKPCWKLPQSIFKAFADIATTFRKDAYKAITDFAIRVTLKIPLSIVKCIIGVARSILVGLLIQGAVLVAFRSPYRARKYIAKLELMVNMGKGYDVSLHNQCGKVDLLKAPLLEAYKIIKKTESFYLAWCFQSRGNIADVLSDGRQKFLPV